MRGLVMFAALTVGTLASPVAFAKPTSGSSATVPNSGTAVSSANQSKCLANNPNAPIKGCPASK